MNNTRKLVIILVLFLVAILSSSHLQSIQASNHPESPLTLLPVASTDKTSVVRINVSAQAEIDTLARTLDVWEVHQEQSFIVAAVSPAELHWLSAAGYIFEIDDIKTAALLSPQAVLDPRYYYFDNDFTNPNGLYLVNFLQDVNATYPDLTELIDAGNAWQGNNGGHLRDMWVLRLTNEDPSYGNILDKPAFFLMAEIHAREVSTPELAIRYIRYLTGGFEGLGGYGVDPDVTWMVNHHVVYVLVMQNPDGHRVDEANTSAYWRKNMNNSACPTGNFGIDLNRNHSFLWGCCGGSSPDPCSETYRGDSEASEPETQAYQDYVMSVIPDANGPNDNWTIAPSSPITTTGFFISLHSYADDILWPWFLPGYPPSPNQDQMESIARKMADIDPYYYPAGTIGYTVDGSANYWTYGKLGIPAFTFEVGPGGGSCGGFFPAYGCIDGIDGMPRDFWAENRPVFIYATKVARQPFANSFGPDATSLVVTPASVPAGVPVDLTATILDQRYGSDPLQPVTAAEYFIDSPGVDGTGFAMAPLDGAWGETNEPVEAVVNTCGLTEGQHYILVHGLNDDGFWGPFTAVFFTINTEPYGVMLTPESASAQADPGQSITYTLQVNNIGLNEDTYDVSISSLWDSMAPISIGPLAPCAMNTFDVQVTIPISATNGESDTALVSVISQVNPGVNDSSSLTSTANFYDLALTPASAQAQGDPGSQVSYSLHLVNLGNAADTFTLQSSSLWDVTLPVSVGPLDPGASVDFTVVVDVPPDALAGDTDTATITAASQGDASRSQVSSLTTTARNFYSFQVQPEPDTLTGYGRGSSVEYTVYITNTGNVSDTYNIYLLSSDWSVDVPAHVGPLERGESASFTIVVHVPFDILMGDTNTAVLTVVSQGSSSGQPFFLYTNTFWYSNFLPLTQR